MLEQENFNAKGEKKQSYLSLYAGCRNYPAKCSACTDADTWQCPMNSKQSPEVLATIERVKGHIS